jgi:hypothetical protein
LLLCGRLLRQRRNSYQGYQHKAEQKNPVAKSLHSVLPSMHSD